MLEAEASRVRRQLSVLALEEVWRTYYEPELRVAAKQRQLTALRGGPVVIGNSNNHVGVESEGAHFGERERVRFGERGGVRFGEREGVRLGERGVCERHANNGGRGPADVAYETGDGLAQRRNLDDRTRRWPKAQESVAQAAKRLTGYSLDTLNKVTWIRGVAGSSLSSQKLREAATRGLQRLSKPGVSVDAVYRSLQRLQRGQDLNSAPPEVSDEIYAARVRKQGNSQEPIPEHTLERALFESSRIAERLETEWGDQLRVAGRQGCAETEMIRAIRVALTSALASVVVIESELEEQPVPALRRIGSEVSQYLSTASLLPVAKFEHGRESDSGRGPVLGRGPGQPSGSERPQGIAA